MSRTSTTKHFDEKINLISKDFTNVQSLTKTLRFKLQPVCSTFEDIMPYITEGQEYVVQEAIVKNVLNRFDERFIAQSLADVQLNEGNLETLAERYKDKDAEKKETFKLAGELREQIVEAFEKSAKTYGMTLKQIAQGSLVTLISENTDVFCESNEEKNAVMEFSKKTTCLTKYNKNRSIYYVSKKKTGAVATRAIDENFWKFVSNIEIAKKAIEVLDKQELEELDSNLVEYHVCIADIVKVSNYNDYIVQEGIDKYNLVICGFSRENGEKVKGLNELINHYNQKNNKKLKKLSKLDKQILGDASSFSYRPEPFETDDELFVAVNTFYENVFATKVNDIRVFFNEVDKYDSNSLYVESNRLNVLSNQVFGNYQTLRELIVEEYNKKYGIPSTKKAQKTREKKLKEAVFSFGYLQSLADNAETNDKVNIIKCLSEKIVEKCNLVGETYEKVKVYLTGKEILQKKLQKNDHVKELLQRFLDSWTGLTNELKVFCENENDTNNEELIEILRELEKVVPQAILLYNKTRNYCTSKPYSNSQYNLTFGSPRFGKSLDYDKVLYESKCFFAKKGEKYYFGALTPENDVNIYGDKKPQTNSYEIVRYKQTGDATKMLIKIFFSAKDAKEHFGLTDELYAKYKSGIYRDKDGGEDAKKACHEMIDYVKHAIPLYKKWSSYDFSFKNPEEYNDWNDFCQDVNAQGYKIDFVPCSASIIGEMIKTKKLFLFEITCKDFTEAAKRNNSRQNLYTKYFTALFNKKNLENLRFKLNSDVTVTYRKASLKKCETAIHPANTPIENKNSNSKKKTSTFQYELVKDKRYTKDQIGISFSITINPNAKHLGNEELNEKVCSMMKASDKINFLGIDRGSRNLLTVVVVNQDGKLLEQKNLNVIGNTNYKEKLQVCAHERTKAKQSWQESKSIKKIKEGYLSQAVPEIVKLAIKWNAVIILEDLNSGFMKKQESMFEGSVYQKFEDALVNKLSYYVDKTADDDELCGVLNGLQLAVPQEKASTKAKQNGIVFYVDPYLTSKIDPTTGFANLVKAGFMKYTTIKKSKESIEKIDEIRYDKSEDLFVFKMDMKKLSYFGEEMSRKWDVYSYGPRIKRTKNANGYFDDEEVNITEELKKFFDKEEIDIDGDIKEQLLQNRNKECYEKFFRLFRLVLQLRNSKSNTDIDFMVSPVKNDAGEFFDSRKKLEGLPTDCDTNGAYNIARKGIMVFDKIKNGKNTENETEKKRVEWLNYACIARAMPKVV